MRPKTSFATTPPSETANARQRAAHGSLNRRMVQTLMARTRQSVLERIVDERVGLTLVGSVSATIDRIAEEIAKEALKDEAFRRTLRELVHRRSEEMLDQLLRKNGKNGK